MSGLSSSRCGAPLNVVRIAIARVTATGKCSFLGSNGRWTAAGSCSPRYGLAATGTYRWSFHLQRSLLAPGRYWIWENATDTSGHSTKNVVSKHVTLVVR